MLETIKETAEYLLKKVPNRPQVAIILGTGLGELASHITNKVDRKSVV